MPIVDIAENLALNYEWRGQTGSLLLLISGFGTAIVDRPPDFLATLEEIASLDPSRQSRHGPERGPMDEYSMARSSQDAADLLDASRD